MYGAFWCSHCYDQKQEFGREAMAEFPYVECFPEGWKKVGDHAVLASPAGQQRRREVVLRVHAWGKWFWWGGIRRTEHRGLLP
jgi:hypothetical protein